MLRTTARRTAAFTMAEMLVVMAIITILAGSLAIVIPKLRTYAMAKRAGSDIQIMSMALESYKEDIGRYPTAPYGSSYACDVLYEALTNPKAGGNNRGWGGAHSGWGFIRSNNIRTHGNYKQILDPWGTTYWYIAHPDYLRGVHIYDPTETDRNPNCFGATGRPDDYRSGTNHNQPPDGSGNPLNYYGPPPSMDEFFNPETFQIHSKGPDQLTDVDDGDETEIDACDRGTDLDDVNNY
ncbi:prepilin-type N-terminal cleavage/methylation domain-containing protein [Planctomycetota bacterium]